MADLSYNLTHQEIADLKENVDHAFLLINGIFVCLMQCGFACLEAGSVRAKNTTNIMMKNLLDIFICGLCYWLVGYTLAYSEGNSFLGYTKWASVGVPKENMAHWFFQFVFAATAATIVSGAVAERCNYVAYIVYSGVISGFVYPVVSHWVWTDEGWLQTLGYRDFAGSGAVHLLAGSCSLVGAAMLGPRIGRFPNKHHLAVEEDEPQLAGHSTPLVGFGGMILIAGFLAFNGGSLGHVSQPGDGAIVAMVMINTVMGGCGGSLIMLAISRLGLCRQKAAWGFANTLNAAFAGMVSVCAAADNMTYWTSFVSGAIAGCIYIGLHLLVVACKVDDPLDTVGVHFGGGLWGLISASVFAGDGLVFGITESNPMSLVYRLLGALAIIAWSVVLSVIMFGTLKLAGLLRVTPEQEMKGLDISMHHEPGYPPEGWHPQPRAQYIRSTIKKERNTAGAENNLPKFRPMAEFHNMAFECTEQASQSKR